jgi:3-dehydroquinate synthase
MPRANIALIGFSTTGKSAVGKRVAEWLGWEFVDIDDEVVKICGKTIPEIFKHEGEDRFRQLEHDALKRTCNRENIVIATGGGAILELRNQDLLHETSIIVCLEAKAETIHQRLMNDTLYSSNPVVRPLLAGDNPLERIKRLKISRQPRYAIADWTVHTDNLNLEEVSREVIRGWRYANRQYNESVTVDDLAFEVETTTGRYPVYVGWGILDKLGDKMKQSSLSGTANIISDETVFSIYGGRVETSLKKNGYSVNCCLVPPGEATKNIDQAIKIYDFLIAHHAERNDIIVALGGGMVGDLAGFVAATFLRGLRWLQVPTTLVGMADASIGGKVAVDHRLGKNLIGSFYQPGLVLADVQTLTTLPRRELISGWPETVKHGLILEADFFGLLDANVEHLLKLTPEVTTKVVAQSANIKAGVVAEDERETGKRIILNYGHTIAHGLEAATGYSRFLHGEAVAIGMVGAAKLSQRLGLLPQEKVQRIEVLLQKFGLPTDCSGVDLDNVLEAMTLDKKVRGKAIRWILLEDIGRVVIQSDVPQKETLEALRGVIKP